MTSIPARTFDAALANVSNTPRVYPSERFDALAIDFTGDYKPEIADFATFLLALPEEYAEAFAETVEETGLGQSVLFLFPGIDLDGVSTYAEDE
jgi:hypothetical protein